MYRVAWSQNLDAKEERGPGESSVLLLSIKEEFVPFYVSKLSLILWSLKMCLFMSVPAPFQIERSIPETSKYSKNYIQMHINACIYVYNFSSNYVFICDLQSYTKKTNEITKIKFQCLSRNIRFVWIRPQSWPASYLTPYHLISCEAYTLF
jgi:hypothetical protein